MTELIFAYITDIDSANGLVKVQIEDLDGIVSDWIQVIFPRTKDKFFWTLQVGEYVCCLFDAEFVTGVCLGSVYISDTAHGKDKDKTGIEFSNGALFQYDKQTGKLTIDLTASGNVEIICNTATIQAADSVELKTPLLSVTGEIRANGDIVAGNITPATRVRLLTHTHNTAVGPTLPPTPTP
jgi:phage baseplate assembly protein V